MKMDIDRLLANEEFQAKLQNAENLSTVAELLKEQGIEITEEQLEASLPKEGELEEANLENVAGGSLAGWVAYRIGYTIGRNMRGGKGFSGGGGGGSR